MSNQHDQSLNADIVIAGGGPAGASLAVRMAVTGHSVILIERERFPRHKLCGEFISPECLEHFRDLGVLEAMLTAGGARIFETRFYDQKGRNFAVPSAVLGNGSAGLSLSRSEMDRILLDRARSAGARVLEGTRVTELLSEDGKVAALATSDDQKGRSIIKGHIFVDATGRPRSLSRLANKALGIARSTSSGRSAAVAFKNHFYDVELPSGVCEIYAFPGGYGGLTTVESGKANLCFLVDPKSVRSFGPKPDDLLRSLLVQNSRLSEIITNARPTLEWHAVSINSFGRAADPTMENLFSIGDSAAFIDPFTGSGMLMAMESSALLATAITEARGGSNALKMSYSSGYDKEFSRRLMVSSLLRKAASFRYFPTAAVGLLGSSQYARHLVATSTRSARGAAR